MNKQIILVIISIMVIGGASLSFLILNQSNKDNSRNGTSINVKDSFPTEEEQYLKYEITENSYRLFKAVEKTTVEDHEVMKVLYGSGYTDFDSIDYPQYLYVDSLGRIWKTESNTSYAIFNYDTKTVYNNYTGETFIMSNNFIHIYMLVMGVWWENQELSIGKEFNYIAGEGLNYTYNLNFKVIKTENIVVPAGTFKAYKIELSYTDTENAMKSATYWVDTETNVLVKWMTSPSNGDDLKEYNL